MSAPDQTGKGMWQDPVFGYYESHGKMKFKPGEDYNMTPAEKSAVMERYKIKELLKVEFLRREFNPGRQVRGVIMDPSIFRWYAALMSPMESFRMSPKTFWIGFMIPLIPGIILGRVIYQSRIRYERECEEGKQLWWDKQNRMGFTGGVGRMVDFD